MHDSARERTWAVVRLALGMLQMAAATVAAVLLAYTGVSVASLWAVLAACALTTASVLLFGSRRPRDRRDRPN